MNRFVFAILSLLGLPSALVAQQFTISQLNISPGGGTLSGGEFSLVGKVEKQNSAPLLNGGAYSIKGDTKSFSVAVHTSGSPRLSLLTTTTHVTISWSADDAVGHILQSSATLGKSAVWQQETSPPVTSEGKVYVTAPLRPGVRFYRLQRTTQTE